MHHLSTKLFTTNVIGLIVWAENAQNLFGFVGAVAGCASAIMLICINWEKFIASRPMRKLLGVFASKK
jgi:hypothetical protein